MKSLRWFLVVFLFGSIAAMPDAAAASNTDSPAAVTKALYHSAVKNMGFTSDTVKADRPWLTPDLYSRLLKKANQPVPKGDAPDIEGDVFLDSQELPDDLKIGESSINQTKAQVKVTLKWGQDTRSYTVLLTQIDGAWKVYEVNYDRDGTLTDLLK